MEGGPATRERIGTEAILLARPQARRTPKPRQTPASKTATRKPGAGEPPRHPEAPGSGWEG